MDVVIIIRALISERLPVAGVAIRGHDRTVVVRRSARGHDVGLEIFFLSDRRAWRSESDARVIGELIHVVGSRHGDSHRVSAGIIDFSSSGGCFESVVPGRADHYDAVVDGGVDLGALRSGDAWRADDAEADVHHLDIVRDAVGDKSINARVDVEARAGYGVAEKLRSRPSAAGRDAPQFIEPVADVAEIVRLHSDIERAHAAGRE